MRPFVSSALTLRWFVLYLTIGLAGVVFYLLLLLFILHLGVSPLLATASAYVITASVQFIVNRNANFRAFDRAVTHQAANYAVVAVLIFLLTMALVGVGVRAIGLSPFTANALTLVITCPLAYLANSSMTFGPGIVARLREWIDASQGRKE